MPHAKEMQRVWYEKPFNWTSSASSVSSTKQCAALQQRDEHNVKDAKEECKVCKWKKY